MLHRCLSLLRSVRLLLVAAALSSTALAVPVFTLSSPTGSWTVVPYPASTTTDFGTDQQTGSGEADIVGCGILPSFYSHLEPGANNITGTLYFRIRLGADDNPAGFKGACFLGVDGNGDGVLDLFFGVDNSGSSNGIFIWRAGTGANTSPSTTSIDSNNPVYSYPTSASNYLWTIVNSTIDPLANTAALLNTDGRTGAGQTDYFVNFAIPYADIVAAFQASGLTVNTGTTLNYVVGTATQANAFNQDLNGVNGGTKSALTWAELGALSLPLNSSGTAVLAPPVITSSTSAAGTTGVAFSYQIAATNTPTSYNATNLPTGLTVNTATGSISGTTAPGTYTVTISATNGDGTGTATLTVTIGKANQTISFGVLSNGTYGDGTRPLAATASSGLGVTYAVVNGPASLSGTTLTITGAGTVLVRASQPGNTNYNPATDVDQSFTVAKAVLTVTADNASRLVGQANPTFTATYGGFVNSETLATSGVAGAPTLSTTATSGSAAGTYPISAATGSLTAANYSFSLVAGMLTVSKNTQTITFGALANGTYGDSSRTLGATASSGLTVSYSLVSGPATLSGSTLSITGVGPVVVRASQSGDGTYQAAANVDQSFTVGKAALTVKADDVNRAYGQTNPTLTASYSGFVNSETLASSGVTGAPSLSTTATTSSAPGTYAITVAVGSLSATNYSFNIVAGNLAVGKADQTVSFGALSNGTYGDGTRTLAATASSLLSVSYSVVSGPASLGGSTLTITGAGTVLLRASQSGNANFNPATDVDQSFTVAKAVLTVTAADASRLAGQANPTFTATYGGFVNSQALATSGVTGSPALSTTATSGSAAGTYPITAATGTLAAANYSFNLVAGTLTVSKNTQTITFGALANGTYGDGARTLGATASSGLAVSYSIVSGPATLSGGILSITGVGTVVVRASQAGDGTYQPATDVDQSFTVGKAVLTVQATNATRAYNQSNPALTVSYSGFVNGEGLPTSGVTGTPSVSTTATSSSAPGTYPITAAVGTLASAKYSFSFSAGTLTLGKADQTISFGALTNGTYGDGARTLAATASSGLAATYAVVSGPASLSGNTLTITSAGTVIVRASQAGNANYNPATDVDQSFTVAKAVLSVTAADANRPVGQPDPTFMATYSGFVNSEALATSGVAGSPALSTTATSGSAAGTYPITAAIGTLAAANYSFSFVAGTLTVGKQAQTITFGALANGTYGESARTLGGTASSALPVSYVVVSGPATLSGSTLTVTGVGTVVVRASQSGDGTYNAAADVDQSFTVGKATLVVKADDASRAYGQANSTLSASYSGFVNSENLATSGVTGSPTLSTTATSSSAAGTYAITAALGTLTSANYGFNFSPGALSVGKADQTITFGALANGTYGESGRTLGATASSNLSVSFVVANGPGVFSGSTLIITGTGTIVVRASQAGSANYNAAADVYQSFTVAKAVVTITADNASRLVGQSNPTFTATYTGFVNGETLATSGISGGPTLSSTADSESNSGTYPITVTAGSLSAANYSFSFVAGSLSVGLQSQTISFGALANGTYGDSSRTLSATASSSLPVSYVVVSGPASVSGNTLTFTGTGTVVVRASQAGNSTYEPAANVDQSFVIQKAVVNVTPVNVSRVSGQSNPTFSATYAGFVASETLANSGISGAPALSSTATSSSPAGSYPITAAAGSLSAANYSFTFSSGTLTVTVAINQAPSFAIAGPAKVMEDAGPQSITSFATSINPGDPSESGQALDFQLSVDQPLLFKVQPTLAADGTLTFTSAPDQNGTAIVTVLLHDDGGVANGGHDASATQTFQIVITPQNDPPKAVTDLASTSGRDPVTMNVLANDTDPEGDVLHLVSATLKGGRGEVTVATGGEVTFTAAAGFHGEATIQYVVADASGAEAQGLFIVQVNAIPEASPDAAHVARNDSVTINVLANDADADADDVLAITKVTCDAGLGQAVRSLDGKTIVFTPALNLIGLATFTYTVSDDHGGSAEATVTVTIDDAVVNLPPVAVADHATTAFGTPVSVPVLANDSDPEGGVLALGTVTVDAIFGTVTVAGTTVLFTPAPAFSGTATVRYQAIDPAGNITDSVALVEVVPAPAPPIAFDDTGRAQAGSTTNFHVLQNDLAPDGGALTLIAASLVDPTQGVVAINNDGTIAFTPAAGFIGQTRIGYTVSSVGALTASAFLTVDVVAVLENSAPQPVNDTGSTQPGKASTLFPLANDSDPEGDLLTLANVTFAPEEGTITFTPEGAVTFTPAPGFTGLATLFYTVTDPTGATATATITVIVNTLPIALPDRLATAPGQALSANVLTNDSDADGHALHVSAFSTDPALGTLTIAANGALQYAPAPGVTGVASFTYTLEDELGGVAEGQIFITVNSAPLAVNDLADIPPDMAASIDVLQNDSDPNGDPLRVVAATIDPALGTVAINDDGTLLYTPASGVRGNVVITYFIADRFGVLSSATLTLTVGDRAPTTTDRTVYGFCYVPLRINALRGAEDPEGGALRVIALTQPRSGHVTISANGYVIFKPRLAMNNPNFQDSFTVTVEDSAGGRSTMTVTVLSLNALKGGYLGLMEPSSTPFPSPAQNVQLAEPLGGMVTVTMGNGATFSGVLRRGTTRVAFHGRLDGSFSYTRKVAIARWPQARLHLTYSPADKSFAAKLLGTDADLIAATGLRRVQPTKARTSSAVLRLGDPALGENATGSISVTVRKNGLAVYRGYLPDGRAFTGGTGYLGAGEIPTYRGFRATRLFARGYAGGTIHFDAVVSSTDLNGSLRQDFGTLRMLDLEPMP